MEINPKMLSMFGQGGSVFGVALPEMAKCNSDIIVLSADVSTPAGLDKFKAEFPRQFINMGIAEANMVGTAAGLADECFRTVCVAQACFMSMRCYEQIRQYSGYMQIPQIYVGFGSGFTLSLMGNTHYALEDIALMKTVPGLQVLAPCDALEATLAFKAAFDSGRPTYIRLFGGTGIPIVHSGTCEFSIGKAIILREGGKVQIIATGSMVGNALAAAEILESHGISASVVDMHTVVPLDSAAIDMNADIVATVEEHRAVGGLGSSVADYLAGHRSHPRLLMFGVGAEYPSVGSYQYLINQCGLDPQSIAEKIMKESEQNT